MQYYKLKYHILEPHHQVVKMMKLQYLGLLFLQHLLAKKNSLVCLLKPKMPVKSQDFSTNYLLHPYSHYLYQRLLELVDKNRKYKVYQHILVRQIEGSREQPYYQMFHSNHLPLDYHHSPTSSMLELWAASFPN